MKNKPMKSLTIELHQNEVILKVKDTFSNSDILKIIETLATEYMKRNGQPLPETMCLTPIKIKNKEYRNGNGYSYHTLPCGKCPPCLQRRSSGWVFRMQQEEKISISSKFITLTYTDCNLPQKLNKETGEIFTTLKKKDFQDYMKRLRKHKENKDIKVKYYACGEYGTNIERPHYHAIVFNSSDNAIAESWHKGHLQILPATSGAMAYVTKYINKFKKKYVTKQNEFSLMSKGLGQNYLDKQTVKFHKADLKRACVMDGNKAVAMPRYYRNKIYTTEERGQPKYNRIRITCPERTTSKRLLLSEVQNARRHGRIHSKRTHGSPKITRG